MNMSTKFSETQLPLVGEVFGGEARFWGGGERRYAAHLMHRIPPPPNWFSFSKEGRRKR